GVLTVLPDQPPALIRYLGAEPRDRTKKDRPLVVRAFDRLPIEAVLADDVDVAGADLVYSVNGRGEASEQLALDRSDQEAGGGKLTWLLAGKVTEGDKVRYRIRYRDNRPPQYGGAQVRHYPEDGWMELVVQKQGKSYREEQIAQERDTLAKKLDEIET